HTGVPGEVAEPHGDRVENLVATGMAERVVDVLESIEIHDQQCDLAPFRLRGAELQIEMPVERVAVGETRERGIRCEVEYSFLFTLADRNIPQYRTVLKPIGPLPSGEASLEGKRLTVPSAALKFYHPAAVHLESFVRLVGDRPRRFHFA